MSAAAAAPLCATDHTTPKTKAMPLTQLRSATRFCRCCLMTK